MAGLIKDFDKSVVAKHSFSDDASDSTIVFKEGDVILVIERPEGEWWIGEVQNKRGYFPHSYTQSFPGEPSSYKLAVAMYDLPPDHGTSEDGRKQNLLVFSAGDEVVLLESMEDKSWYFAFCHGRVGYVPAHFVAVQKKGKARFSSNGPQNVVKAEREIFKKRRSLIYQRSVSSISKQLTTPECVILKVFFDEARSKAMKFKRDATVGEVVISIQKKMKFEGHKNHGLYIPPPMGMWCNDFLPLHSYYLDDLDSVIYADKDSKQETAEEDQTGSQRYALVLWTFTAQEDSNFQLSVEQGVLVEIVDMVSDDWWECLLPSTGVQGFVPRSYLALQEETKEEEEEVGMEAPRNREGLEELQRKLLLNDPKLTTLTFQRCSYSTETVMALAAALKYNEVVTKLKLSYHALQSPANDLPHIWLTVRNQLTVLDISHTSLNLLSPEISSLARLQELNLNHNHLTTLPSSIGMMTTLTNLDTSWNKLTTVPEQLHMLKNLEVLRLSHNKLGSLPSFLLSLKRITTCTVDHNPIKGFPKEVIERGNQGLFHFMKNMLGGSAMLYRMKLMIVGQENVGKTSLLRTLKKESDKKSKDKKKGPNLATDGIDIQEWNVKASHSSSPDQQISFSAWDFAGQDVYYSTHHLFLSSRAIYLIVFNALDFVSSKVDYWVRSVLLRAPKCPIIFVGTHIDEKNFSDERLETAVNYLRRRYSQYKNVVAIHSCSAKTGLHAPELRQLLIETALKQPYMPEQVPLRYVDLQAKVLSLRHVGKFPTITWTHFSEMARDSNIEEESFKSVATYFNDLGVIAYFPEVDEEVVIIDPQWITKMFATIITTGGQASFVKNGILKAEDFLQLWKMHPPELHPYMFSLLERFEVIHRVGNMKDSPQQSFLAELNQVLGKTVEEKDVEGLDNVFVPSLLDECPESSILASHWTPYKAEETVFGRVYKFEFLFRGFFPLLTVRFLRSKTWVPVYYWRNGIILRDIKGAVKARLVLTDELQLTLYLRGTKDSMNALSNLLTVTNALITDWLKKQAEVLVPCIQCLRHEKGRKLSLIPLADCESAVAANRPFVVCASGNHTVEVKDIAPDITLNGVQVLQLDLNKLTVEDEVGRGGWGVVYRARYRGGKMLMGNQGNQGNQDAIGKIKVEEEGGGAVEGNEEEQLIALKKFNLTTFKSATRSSEKARREMYLEFQKEVSINGSLSHPKLVRMLGVVTEPTFGIAMEFMDRGDLYGLINHPDQTLNWVMRFQLSSDIAEGMRFLHSLKLMHRDLKSPNVLLKTEGRRIVAKIADFGLAKELESIVPGEVTDISNPTWLAPEVLSGHRPTLKVDVYSFGVILWELLTRRKFFQECSFAHQIEDKVKKGERPVIPDVPSEFSRYSRLIESCWSQECWERPSFIQICKQLKLMSIQTEKSIQEESGRTPRNLSEPPSSSSSSSSASPSPSPSPSPLSASLSFESTIPKDLPPPKKKRVKRPHKHTSSSSTTTTTTSSSSSSSTSSSTSSTTTSSSSSSSSYSPSSQHKSSPSLNFQAGRKSVSPSFSSSPSSFPSPLSSSSSLLSSPSPSPSFPPSQLPPPLPPLPPPS